MISKILLGCFPRFQQRSEFPRTSGTEGGRRTDKEGNKRSQAKLRSYEASKKSKLQSCVNSLWAELRRLRRKSSTAAFGLFTGIVLLAYVQVLGFDGRTRNSFFSSIRVSRKTGLDHKGVGFSANVGGSLMSKQRKVGRCSSILSLGLRAMRWK